MPLAIFEDAMTTTGMSALGSCDLIISQGADNVYKFIYSTSDGVTTTPVDLTGWSARAQVRTSVGGTIWCTLSSPSTGIVLGTTDGSITVTIAASVTTAPSWDANRRAGRWDLELTNPNGVITRFVEGAVQLAPDVTR